MPTQSDVLLVAKRSSIVILTMNRPHVRNALDSELARRLMEELDRFESDPALRVAVITGTGGFSSGMDLGEFARTNRPPWESPLGLAAVLKRRLRKPIIAAVEKFAIAGGFELALACDLIVASGGTVLGIPEVKRGLVAAGGGLRRLPRALPHQLSAELALTGRTLSAERAHRLGLVNRLTAPGGALDAAIELAEEIAEHRPVAVEVTKQVLDQQRDWNDAEFWERQQVLADPLFRDEDATIGARKFLAHHGSERAVSVPDDAGPVAQVVEPATLPDLIRTRATEHPNRTFLRFEADEYTYAQVDDLTNAVANTLRTLGVIRGSNVAVFMKNSPEFLWVTWGLAKLGAVSVPLNVEARGDQLTYFLSQSESTSLVIDGDLMEVVTKSLPDLATFDNFIHRGALTETPPEGSARRVVDIRELLSGDTTPVLESISPSDLSALNYTSGTTGPSKAAMSPHGQPIAVARLMAREFGYSSDDVFFTCLPLFHVNASWYTCVTALSVGASVVLSRKFSASRFWGEVREAGATVVNLLGAMANILEKREPGVEERSHRVRVALVAPTTPDLVQLFKSRFGIDVISLFAATETFPISILPAHEVNNATAGSCGRESALAEIRIADADGRPVSVGEPGEILVRPRHATTMSLGYWNMPEQTAAVTGGLWFHTGDRAHLDEDGYLHFVDRIKEVIRRRGENISSFEVETVIHKHPDVVEVAAVPILSEMSEDEVGVFVVRRAESSLTEAELIEFCKERMAKFMVPRYVKWIEDMPKTASQKIEKYKLRSMAADTLAEFWDREQLTGVTA